MGDDLARLRARVGMVFQQPTPFPMSIYENIAFGVRQHRQITNVELDGIVERVLTRAALWDEVKDKLKSPGTSLSGGQQQRLCIARALAVNPPVLLMDEPFVSLDQPTRERMQREVLNIWEHRKRTIIFVTHNLEEAVFLGDRILMLSSKPARIVADITDDLPRPRDILSPAFTRLRSQCASILNEVSEIHPGISLV